ncbi:MAG: glycoside hydrolase family 43 [Verrucomicrobia bacterium]|nr:MAG: glycoside hydrolase family 43 [Verrucomicrobiota bacterium]
MVKDKKIWLMSALGVLIIGIIAFVLWQSYMQHKKKGIISGNGRIEATEINIAPRMAGQILKLLVKEGDYVKAGEILVYMDPDVLEAQLREAQGKLLKARTDVTTSQSKLMQKKSEKAAAEAILVQREAELEVAQKRLARSSKLVEEGATSEQIFDDDTAASKSAEAAVNAARAQLEAAEAAIATAQDEVAAAEAAVEAYIGNVERIKADINDSALKTPRDGRVQYRVAQKGEVVAAGSPILNMVDLSDVYMTFFIPTAYTGKISLGEEARIILDAKPNDVIPAYISFISDVAQFTPKSVETAAEREKLMFRIKAQIPEDYLKEHITTIKTGLPGLAYIRIDPDKPWPDFLEIKN